MDAPSGTQVTRLALVVVTDSAIRRLCRETLGNAGFAVSNSIESGAAAVVHAREEQPDVILLSQQLADVPATEAVKWLRSNSESAKTPIIVLGGNADAKPSGAQVMVLPRPITAAQLRDALIDALDRKEISSGAAS